MIFNYSYSFSNFAWFLYYGLFSAILVFIILFLASLLSFKTSNASFEKLSPYECGFNPFEDTRHQFDISFYLLGILFILFDLEVSYLFPWIVNLNVFGPPFYGYFSMLFFLAFLTFGFIYEWYKGVIDFI